MKKLLIFMVLTFLTFTSLYVEVDAYFRIDDAVKNTQYIDGVRHQEVVGTINFNGTESKQKINYLGVDPTKDDIAIVTGDNYMNHGWGKGDLNTIIDNINTKYDNYEVIGGVNGDFFGANGIPIEAFIRDFSVISAGLGYERTVLGFKDDGEVVFTRPCFDGYELVVYNGDDERKDTVKIDYINEMPSTSFELSVFFDDYESTIINDYNKVIMNALETHHDDYGHTYYGRGELIEQSIENITEVNPLTFVIVGSSFNDNDLITEGDYAIVQKSLCGVWEDVRFAISGWEVLVEDGEAPEVFTAGAGPQYRHPRTAVGIKEDGTVFFVVVDGRDDFNRWVGMTAYEMSELMLYFGAVDAFNLDGGGSSTMVLKDEDGIYNVMNTPSDGHLRPVTNGVFFVKGNHIPRTDAIFPDNRIELDLPKNIMISRDGHIEFDSVDNAVGYEIMVNDVASNVEIPEYKLAYTPGEFEVKIKVLGDGIVYKDSEYTELITFYLYNEDINNIIEFFVNYSKEETTD